MLLTALIAPLAVAISAAADVRSAAEDAEVQPAAADAQPCCVQVVPLNAGVSAQSASRLRVVPLELPRLLPPGDAPESGLQVQTILTARSISALFPAISNIGGVRPDSLRWHPDGLALDVIIPNPESAEGIALGDQIVAFVLKYAERFGVQDAIWRGTYYTPGGTPQYGGYGHYDHVHVTTYGGGYPVGDETYVG